VKAAVVHQFHFRTRLLLVLPGRLIAKMRRASSTKHLVDDEFGLHIADHSPMIWKW